MPSTGWERRVSVANYSRSTRIAWLVESIWQLNTLAVNWSLLSRISQLHFMATLLYTLSPLFVSLIGNLLFKIEFLNHCSTKHSWLWKIHLKSFSRYKIHILTRSDCHFPSGMHFHYFIWFSTDFLNFSWFSTNMNKLHDSKQWNSLNQFMQK